MRFTVSLSFPYSLSCSLSQSLFQRAKSTTLPPQYIQANVLQSAHVLGSCSFVAVMLSQ